MSQTMLAGAFVGQRTDTGVAEHGLYNVSTAHHVGNGDSHDADVGGKDIPQTMFKHNFFLRVLP